MRRIAGAVAVVVVALIVGLLLIEGGLRLAGISYPDFFREDPVLGRALNPGVSGWWTSEGNAYVRINSAGMRDQEHTLEKPADVVRIAVLGDSYAAAFEVPQPAAFWSVAGRALDHCPALAGKRVEMLNFGIGGAGTALEYLILQNRVWRYHPDVVLLAFLPANDISDNSRVLKGSSRSPYFVYDDQGRLVLDPAFVVKRKKMQPGPLDEFWLAALNHSRILQVVMQAWRGIELAMRPDVTAHPAIEGQEAGLNSAIYAPPATPVWQQAWRVTEDLIRAINADVHAHGAQFAMAILTGGIQVHPDKAVRERFQTRLGVPDLLYPDRRIAALAEAENIPFVTLVPELRSWAEANQTCVHGFPNADPCGGHWNEYGHRLAGERIARLLCETLAEPPASVSRTSTQ